MAKNYWISWKKEKFQIIASVCIYSVKTPNSYTYLVFYSFFGEKVFGIGTRCTPPPPRTLTLRTKSSKTIWITPLAKFQCSLMLIKQLPRKMKKKKSRQALGLRRIQRYKSRKCLNLNSRTCNGRNTICRSRGNRTPAIFVQVRLPILNRQLVSTY